MKDIQRALALHEHRLQQRESALVQARQQEASCAKQREESEQRFIHVRDAAPSKVRGLYTPIIGTSVSLDELDRLKHEVTKINQHVLAEEAHLLEAEKKLHEATNLTQERRQEFSLQTVRTQKYSEWRSLLLAEQRSAQAQAEESEIEELASALYKKRRTS